MVSMTNIQSKALTRLSPVNVNQRYLATETNCLASISEVYQPPHHHHHHYFNNQKIVCNTLDFSKLIFSHKPLFTILK